MHLVQFLLPLYDNKGNRVPRKAFSSVRDELTNAIGGGLTARIWRHGSAKKRSWSERKDGASAVLDT
jgi:hypothetical protein